MAIPKLWRASDDYLISDKPTEWGRWQETSGLQSNELLIGSIFHEEQMGNEFNEGAITFKFADEFPNSTLANMDKLKAIRRNSLPVKFQDFRGTIYVCDITTDLSIDAAPSRLVERNYVTVNLRRAGGDGG